MPGSDRIAKSPALFSEPSGDAAGSNKPTQGNNHPSHNQTPNVSLTRKQESIVGQPQAHTEQPDPYQLRDLKAQEIMAYWAMWMFVAAVLTFIITSIGTWLIWRQVKLTREAVEDTGKATKAMERQNELTERHQRPWIDIDLEFQFISESQDGLLLVCNAVLKNIGAMPAIDAVVWHVPATMIRNPIFDLKISAEAPFAEISEDDETMIVLPGGTSRQQIFVYLERKNPHHSFDDGIVPSLMLVADYSIPNGERSRSAAWFTVATDEREQKIGLIPWDLADFDQRWLAVECHGYIAVT